MIASSIIGIAALAMTGIGGIFAAGVAASEGAGLLGIMGAGMGGLVATSGSTVVVAAGTTAGVASATASSIDLGITPKSKMTKSRMASDSLNIVGGALGGVSSLASYGTSIAKTYDAVSVVSALTRTNQIVGYTQVGVGLAQSGLGIQQSAQTGNKQGIAVAVIGMSLSIAGLGVSTRSDQLASIQEEEGIELMERQAVSFSNKESGMSGEDMMTEETPAVGEEKKAKPITKELERLKSFKQKIKLLKYFVGVSQVQTKVKKIDQQIGVK